MLPVDILRLEARFDVLSDGLVATASIHTYISGEEEKK